METGKKCILCTLQMEIVIDLARTRGVCELRTVCEDRSFKKFDWEREEEAIVGGVCEAKEGYVFFLI